MTATGKALLTSFLLCAAACSRNVRNPKSAILYSESGDPVVKNGTAFDRGSLDLGENKVLAVPEDAHIESSDKPGKITVLMRKTMGYTGHPPNWVSIDDARSEMGCAWRAVDGRLQIAKYGEFSCFEGGQRLELTIRVPPGIRVEKLGKEFERPDEKDTSSSPLKKHGDDKKVWYAIEASSEAWTPIPFEPDHETFGKQ